MYIYFSIVNPKEIEIHSKMISLITSLNNYLVLIDGKRVMFVNENKVFIQKEVEESIHNALSVSGTNDVILNSNLNVYFLYFNGISNEIEVKTILKCDAAIYDMKIQNDHLIIVESYGLIYIYKLHGIKINNISNPTVINKKLKEYCNSLDKKYFNFLTYDHELFVYKLDDEIKQIAFSKLNEDMDCLVSSEKYISMVNKSKENILTFEIIDETI
jgi:hypothetical protein